MNKPHTLAVAFATLLPAGIPAAQAALPNGTVLGFDPGQVTCIGGVGTPPNCPSGTTIGSGSYFAVDTNDNGVIDPEEKFAITPGPDGGIVVGVAQPASGSHPGPPNGSENPHIDQPWTFFGNTGMFQTTAPVIDNGDGTLDFRGFGVTWSGIPNIPLGGDPTDFAQDTGRATITCPVGGCQPGGNFLIDYSAHVPLGDPSGFGGIMIAVHLEHVAGPSAHVTLSVSGGNNQQCTGHNGNTVTIDANTVVPPNDTTASIAWTVDGNPAGNGASISPVLAVGTHNIHALVTTAAGLTATADSTVTIRDTLPPKVTATFVDRQGNPVTTLPHSGRVRIQATATDMCDPKPTVTATVGAPVSNGGIVSIRRERGVAVLDVSTLTLSVHAVDASGNTAASSSVLTIPSTTTQDHDD